ncbi:MAG: dTMP kinase [Desulfobacterales bacterium]
MLITLEGIEGSGKTTQIDYITAYLRQSGRAYVVTKKPGGTEIGKKIRAMLLDPENREIDPVTELLLYARTGPSMCGTHPAHAFCRQGGDLRPVLRLRYRVPGFTRGMDMRLTRQLNEVVLDGLMPDVTYLLDLPPAVGLGRAWSQISDGSRSKSEARFENETLHFREQVRNGYLALARSSLTGLWWWMRRQIPGSEKIFYGTLKKVTYARHQSVCLIRCAG